MTVRARAYPAAILVLAVGLLLAHPANASPNVVDEGNAIHRVTWDFASPADYLTQNASIVPGVATLAKANMWTNFTNDTDFSMAQMQVINVAIGSGVRLAGNTSNLIADGSFDAIPGPWTYTNGTNNAVTARRDVAGRARLGHQSAVLRFDSMDNVFGPNSWVSIVSNPGEATSILYQETTIRAEGSGSLRNDVTVLQNGGWGGAARNDTGFWDWSGYNRLAIRMNKATPGFVTGFVYVQDRFGAVSFGLMTPVTGWFRYAFDLNGSVDLSAVDSIGFGFGTPSVGVTATIYVDDIVLLNSTAFAESARVSQTFAKPFSTGVGPNALALHFDVEATAAANVGGYLAVTVNNSVEWAEIPVTAGVRTVDVDLSGNAALRETGSFVLGLTLQLNRTGWEEASMTVWIDNIRLVAPYANGSFTSLPIDAGSPAVWGNLALNATTPLGTSVAVETRTGNTTSPGDGSWTAWQPLLQNATQSPPNRYLQWRLLLMTGGADTPVVRRLEISYGQYASLGEIRTTPFLPAEPLVAWRQFLANHSIPASTGLVYDLSLDGGVTWTGVVTGQDVSPLPTSSVVVRATLTTSNTSRTPSISSWSIRYEVSTASGAPRINGVVPDQVSQEDSPAWSLDLIPFAQPQGDPADTLGNLKWYVTGINTSMYTVFGADTFGRHTLVFTPARDAFGTDDATLWLEDRDGVRASQPLRVTIEPVNDAPVWTYLPEVWVQHDQPYTLLLSPYVTDLDNPRNDLVFSTDDPSHVTTTGPNATYLYAGPSRTIFVGHFVTDGQALPTPALVTIHITDSPPPQSRRPIPDVTLTEDVKEYDVFRPDSLSDYFVGIQGELLFLTSNFTNLKVEMWRDGSVTKVNVSAKPDFCGIDRITFRATDARNAFAEYTSTVKVLCVNDPPVLGWTEDIYVRFDASYRLDLSSFVADVDNERDELSLTTNDPVHARASQFSVTFLYPSSEFGPNPVTVPVDLLLTDGRDVTSSRIQVLVSDNRPPEIVRAFDELRFLEDTFEQNVLNLPLHFADDRDTNLEYRVSATTLNVTLASGLVSLRPPRDWFGRDTLVVRAVDSRGAYALANVAVEVLPVNDAPVLTKILLQARDRGGEWIVDLRSYAHDIDDDLISLNFTTNSPRVVAVGYLLMFNYPDRPATEDVLVTVRDPGNLTASVMITVRVGPSVWSSIFWPWSGLAAVGLAAVSYAGWRARERRRYTIEDFMIIGHEGLLIAHTTRRERPGPDSDVVAAMMTATLMFIRDSYREDRDELQRFELSDKRVGIIQRSRHVYGVAMAVGRPPDSAYLGLKGFLDELERRFGDRLAAQVGAFDDVLPELTWAMSRFARRGRYRVGDFERSPAVGPGQVDSHRRWGVLHPRRMERPDPAPAPMPADPSSDAVRKDSQ